MSVQEWFEGAGLGLFVHWDHASQQGIELSWPLVGKSIVPGVPQVEDEVSIAQYQSSAATFDPVRWDPSALARLARSCGARYVVLTSRHHAGFSMFHTKFSTFSIENSPFRRDIVREFVEAVVIDQHQAVGEAHGRERSSLVRGGGVRAGQSTVDGPFARGSNEATFRCDARQEVKYLLL